MRENDANYNGLQYTSESFDASKSDVQCNEEFDVPRPRRKNAMTDEEAEALTFELNHGCTIDSESTGGSYAEDDVTLLGVGGMASTFDFN